MRASALANRTSSLESTGALRSWVHRSSTGSLAHIDCTVETVHDGGDHYVVFGRVASLGEVRDETERPLLFYRGQYTGIEPDKTVPAPWRDDLEAFLTTASEDTWL